MMDCNKFVEQISALVDKELSIEEAAVLRSHIRECPECSAVYAAFREIAQCLPEMSVAPPDNLKDSIMQKIRDEAKPSKRPKLPIFRYAGLAAVFALVIFAAVNGGRVTNSGHTADPEEPSAYAGEQESVSFAAPGAASEDPSDGLGGSAKNISPQSVYDMHYFSNYLETISSEEYESAADGYEGELYAILVLEGDVPTLREMVTLHENNREVYLEVSKDEMETLRKNSDDGLLIMHDENAERGILVIKKMRSSPEH